MRMLPALELLDPKEEKTVVVFSDASNAAVDDTSAPDTIVVRGVGDTVSGFGGDDFVFGVGEANLLYSDSTVAEGPDAGTGSDILVGGAGDDTFSFGFVPQARLPVLDTGGPDGPHGLVMDFSRAEGDVIDLSTRGAPCTSGRLMGAPLAPKALARTHALGWAWGPAPDNDAGPSRSAAAEDEAAQIGRGGAETAGAPEPHAGRHALGWAWGPAPDAFDGRCQRNPAASKAARNRCVSSCRLKPNTPS